MLPRSERALTNLKKIEAPISLRGKVANLIDDQHLGRQVNPHRPIPSAFAVGSAKIGDQNCVRS